MIALASLFGLLFIGTLVDAIASRRAEKTERAAIARATAAARRKPARPDPNPAVIIDIRPREERVQRYYGARRRGHEPQPAKGHPYAEPRRTRPAAQRPAEPVMDAILVGQDASNSPWARLQLG